jgi:O-glycosyl hydrolase
MKKAPVVIGVFTGILLFSFTASGQINNGSTVNLQVDGSKVFQEIDGFGVNANTRSWNGVDLQPALKLMLDSMNATIWRVVVETVEKWEEVNDNNDPFVFNWDYYGKLYKTPKFQKAFAMIRYLNDHGITNRLMINFMGRAPLWMGGEEVKPEFEDEYVEMLVSFFYYARFTEHLQFGLVSPMNEPDMRKEGPTMGPEQYVRVLKKTMRRMQDVGLGDVRYVAPDVASMNNGIERYLPLLMKDPEVMSKIEHLGLHSYGGYYADFEDSLKRSAYPASSLWITEWNSWRDGLDDGKIGVYDYKFASECIYKLLLLLQHGASAGIAWEGYDSYYEHHAPSLFSYWGILGYDSVSRAYTPRKHFYAISQVSKFVLPGCRRIGLSAPGDSLFAPGDSLGVLAFYDSATHTVSMVGVNRRNSPVMLKGGLAHLPSIRRLRMLRTSSTEDMHEDGSVTVTGNSFEVNIPPNCIFTLNGQEEGSGLTGDAEAVKGGGLLPEPAGWYTGDIHVHRNCGDGTPVFRESTLSAMMEPNDLSVISLLADNGNGEVKVSQDDLPKVSGKDAAESRPGRIIHWDAEWHWDASYSDFDHQALGGHLILLGLQKTQQIWNESAGKVLQSAREQGAIAGFAHMEYLNDSIQNRLNCCIPIDYPAEAALGTIDFMSEDVYGIHTPNSGSYFSEGGLRSYYRLLNCGFRIGLAAGTDFPCNYNEPLGSLLTYVDLKDQPLSYRGWIEGIKKGRTVVSRDGHNEFLELKVNGRYGPGDVVPLKKKDAVTIEVKWTDTRTSAGRIELVSNGKVVSVKEGTATPGSPLILKFSKTFSQSGWVCARRMDENGHVSHTAPVYVLLGNKPVRASAADAQYFIDWIDNILKNITPGGIWSKYYTHDPDSVRGRYLKARDIYARVRREAGGVASAAASAPILVLGGANAFGPYIGEILKTEGFNEFQMDSMAAKPTLKYLRKFDLIILGESPLTPQDRHLLEQYVKGGGNLIAFRPDKQLNEIFGIGNIQGVLHEGYIAINGKTAVGKGSTTRALQFHGEADKYTLRGGEKIAGFCSGSGALTGYPAVVMNQYGKGHGAAVLFNLPQSIAFTRQGNFRYAGREMDGINGLRAMDLFTNGWVDSSKNLLNQADEEMRLFSRCIERMSSYTKPLARFWYFPDSLKCLVVLNNDGENSPEDEFEPQFEDVDAKGAKMTVYIKDVEKVSRTWADKWQGRGFEISGHTNDIWQAPHPTWAGMDSALSGKANELRKRLGILQMRTVVNHWFVWCGNDADGRPDAVAQARLEAKNGIELDANYAHYDNNSPQGHFLGASGYDQGNYTGSGLPMRFTDGGGRVLPIYQLLNNVYDQQYMEHKDPEGFYQCFKGLMDRSLDSGVYSYITVKAHADEYYFSKTPLMKMLDLANSRGVPVWTAAKLVDFLKARDEAFFDELSWKDDRLSFKIRSSLAHNSGLTWMLPYRYKGKKINKVRVNGHVQPYIVRAIKGSGYILVTVKSGAGYDVVANYVK